MQKKISMNVKNAVKSMVPAIETTFQRVGEKIKKIKYILESYNISTFQYEKQ